MEEKDKNNDEVWWIGEMDCAHAIKLQLKKEVAKLHLKR